MPNKIILAINAGSSSVKACVFSYEPGKDDSKELAVIQVAGLTAPPSTLKYDRGDKHTKDQELSESDIDPKNAQETAYEFILKTLVEDAGLTQLGTVDDIEFITHRVVHGGDYTEPVRIDKDTYQHLERLSDLAPLHNAGALAIVKAVHAKSPKATNVAFFDTTFHSTIPTATRTYAIDPTVAEKNGLRKYGFHGLSYAFIARACAGHLSVSAGKANIIALHLGSGASACCIRAGQSIDTSMGLTPLAGLPGATRSGDVDPSLIFHFTHSAGELSAASSGSMHITQAEEILNKKSGWKALTGTTDFGAISQKAEEGDEQCKLAFDLFVDRIVDFVASYYVKLAGDVDALAFAGGIGEKGSALRKAVVEKVGCLGFELDDSANNKPGDEVVVDVGKVKEGKKRILICQTDEQTEMARGCAVGAEKFGRPG